MTRGRTQLEPSAVEMAEEAIHLLRSLPVGAWAVYYGGCVPLVVAVLYFWAHTTWFRPAPGALALGSLLIALFFVVMKAAQSEFCARALALRSGRVVEGTPWNRLRRMGLSQASLQPWALIAVLFAFLVGVPFGWVFAYAQSATVVGAGPDLHRAAVDHAKAWPGQNHLGLALISAVGIAAWLNIGVAFVAVPWLANRLLGIENMFGLTGWWFFNSTFVVLVTALTWLAVDPLVKAFYVVRVFHVRARKTGADLRLEFAAAPALRRTGGVAVLLLALAMPFIPAPARGATVAAQSPAAVEPARLDRTIDEVLQRPEFTWRLPPAQTKSEPQGAVASFFDSLTKLVREMIRSAASTIRRILDWFEVRLQPKGATKGGSGAASAVSLLLWTCVIVIVLLLVWLVYAMLRDVRRRGGTVVAAQPVQVATPDLRDENIHASQLPADGWLELARAEAARGEWRLALRAVYLATLARLAGEGLLSLAKHKTNLDYESELRRRAVTRAELVPQFSRRRVTFEEVWYGNAVAQEATVRGWIVELEGGQGR